MAAPMRKPMLTFSKLAAFQRASKGAFCIRNLRSLNHPNQDLKPGQAEKNHPDTIRKKDGQWKKFTNLTYWRNQRPVVDDFDAEKLDALLAKMNISLETENDMPVDMPDPYTAPRKRCLLCKYDVKLDYKNTQLLSQFVSPYTGRIYGRHVTGLCLHMQRRVAREIRISRQMGFMPYRNKLPQYLEDPLLFNPFKKAV